MSTEENKVATKLAEVIDAAIHQLPMTAGVHRLDLATAILQSPDLRVTLVDRSYIVTLVQTEPWRGFYEVAQNGRGRWTANFIDRNEAQEYADWLNSKAPK